MKDAKLVGRCPYCDHPVSREKTEEAQKTLQKERDAAVLAEKAKVLQLQTALHDIHRKLEAPRRLGRPTKPPVAGERIQIGVQVSPNVKSQLDAAAERNHRSVSREAEFRLERSFDRSNLLEEVLTLAFGERPAGLLLALGVAMQGAAQMALLGQGHRVHEDWTSDPDAYREAFNAVHLLSVVAKPAGEWSGRRRGQGNYYAGALVRELAGTGRTIADEQLTPHADALRRLLGPIAIRMHEELPRLEERIEKQRKRMGVASNAPTRKKAS